MFSFLGNFCSNETLKFISSPFLKSLDLSYNQDVSIEGLYYLSSVARDTLKELSLSHCSRLVSKREEAREILPQLFPNLEKINLRYKSMQHCPCAKILI